MTSSKIHRIFFFFRSQILLPDCVDATDAYSLQNFIWKICSFRKNLFYTIWKLSWTYLHRKDSKYCFSWLQVYTSVNFSRVITTKSGSSVILVINQINLFKDWIHCFQRISIWTGKKDVKFQFSTKMNPQISVKKQISWKKEWLLKKFICVNPNNL